MVRWGTTGWKKWYVRIVRLFMDIKAQYRYQREYNQYMRDLSRWWKDHGRRIELMVIWNEQTKKYTRNPKTTPPMPLPPPIHIAE